MGQTKRKYGERDDDDDDINVVSAIMISNWDNVRCHNEIKKPRMMMIELGVADRRTDKRTDTGLQKCEDASDKAVYTAISVACRWAGAVMSLCKPRNGKYALKDRCNRPT